MRVGIGYDSHRFAEGRRLVLGGVEIPHPQGLAGWSDADVVCHALIDAMLDDGRRRHGAMHDVYVLSRLEDPATLRLRTPIPHTHVGRGSAWTQGQRYTSEAALLANPRSTDDLD